MLLLTAATFLLPSCSDDKATGDDEYSSERLFMPMFRRYQNTNDGEDDPYRCAIASELTDCSSNHVNDVMLYWYGVEGAESYRIKAKIQGTEWDRDEVLDTIVSADVLEMLHEDLQYSVGYSYAIKAISPKGEAYDSKWYGYGDGSHQNDYMTITTGDRYDVPSVFWVENVTESSMRVYFDNTAEAGYETSYSEFLDAGCEVVDGKYVFDEISIVPSADNPTLASLYHTMTAQDYANGYVDFDGLESNGSYIVTGQNNSVSRYYDRQYNKISVRMVGETGDPILIEWYCDPNDTILSQAYASDLSACRIDTVLENYMSDNTIAEGQVYYLEGGKTYYTQSNVAITKGFTLETNPEDIAAGKGRATVLLGVGSTDADGNTANTNNFMLCRNALSAAENGVMFVIQPITFNEINFSVHKYHNYLDKNGTDGNSDYSISANYFINMYSQGLSFSLSELNVTNCTFSGMIRGFIRFQGPNRQVIEHFTVDGCVFYDCGLYDTNGRGYSWFAGPGNNKNSNFFQNLTITNNSFIDCPRHALVSENGNLAWPTGTTWNILIENNTFINFSPRSSSTSHGLIFETRYAPSGSTIALRKNLFVMVRKGDSDSRNLYMKGMRIDTRDISYDFSDNYATTVPDWTTTNLIDGLFTGYAFSDTSYGAGYQNGALNAGGMDEVRIKFGDNANGNESDAVGYQLTPEELFKDPTPLATEGYKDMYRHNVDGFYYNNTSKVTSHPIYTKNIGDPRWKNVDAWK